MIREFEPKVVATSFIKQFYERLSKNPHELYRYYKEESHFMHYDGNKVTQPCSGVDNIRRRIAELKLSGAKVDLSEGSIDAQKSESNGVLVVVMGRFKSNTSSISSSFVQTFFLSYQANKSSSASYFLKNSIFRIIDSPSIPDVSSTLIVENCGTVSEKQKTDQPSTPIKSSPQLFNTAEQCHPVDGFIDNNDGSIELFDDILANHTSHSTNEVCDNDIPKYTSNNDQVDNARGICQMSASKSKTWLDAAKSSPIKAADQALSSPIKSVTKISTPINVVSMSSSAGITIDLPSTQLFPKHGSNLETATAESTVFQMNGNLHAIAPRSEEHRLKHSVYVCNIHFDTTYYELRAAFEVHGNVIRLDAIRNKGYAFVEYDTLDSVHKVLTLPNPIQLRGSKLIIHERSIGNTNSKPHQNQMRQPRNSQFKMYVKPPHDQSIKSKS